MSEIRAFKRKPVPLGLKPASLNARSSNLTFLFHLRQGCASPKLGTSPTALYDTVENFSDWLEVEITVPGVNLPVIGVVADLRVARIGYIKMCSDIAKHSLARLATNIAHLCKLLEIAGRPVSEQQAYRHRGLLRLVSQHHFHLPLQPNCRILE